MGKVGFTKIQEKIFNEFVKTAIASKFYFTGGTALSVFYLHHRESEDLDFFSEEDFDNELIFSFMNHLSTVLGRKYRFTQKYKTRLFEFMDNDKVAIKLDFVHYPYKRVNKGEKYLKVDIDSLLDIGANKLLTINQRTDVKDFVDLYFILKQFTMWDLLYAVENKFRMELDILLIASDFLKVEEFDFLPKMLVPLTNKELTGFFRAQAREIGKQIRK